MLNLHRLGVDDVRWLPEPPRSSIYYERWSAAHGRGPHPGRTIYLDKFEAYYGRTGDARTPGGHVLSGAGTLLPIAVAGVVFTVGWASILLDPTFISSVTGSTADALRFGFLGAYSFCIQMLLRRYFQNDLRAGAYLSCITRVVIVLTLVLVLHQVRASWDGWAGAEMAVAYVVGFFPLVG